jgi:hypothetical protein
VPDATSTAYDLARSAQAGDLAYLGEFDANRIA